MGSSSLEAARSEYGVVIDPETLKADSPGTFAYRNDLRRTREQPKLFHRFIYFDDDEEERRWIETQPATVGSLRHCPRLRRQAGREIASRNFRGTRP